MRSAVQLRRNCPASELHRLSPVSKDVRQSTRLLSLAVVLDSMSRADVART